jgi:hypothetical protein
LYLFAKRPHRRIYPMYLSLKSTEPTGCSRREIVACVAAPSLLTSLLVIGVGILLLPLTVLELVFSAGMHKAPVCRINPLNVACLDVMLCVLSCSTVISLTCVCTAKPITNRYMLQQFFAGWVAAAR